MNFMLDSCLNVNIFSSGRRARSDAWALDTAKKPYIWKKINPEGDKPPARM